MKNKIYVLDIDAGFDETLKKFRQQLASTEEIVNTSISETKLVVVTKNTASRNLLTDELRRK
jgi:predicted DNA binding CopG/RHH family protein